MQVEQVMAFATETEPPGLEIRINFGVFAGRDASSAEIEELGRLLVPEAGDVAIVAEQRHEMSGGREVVLHQVRVEIPPEKLPAERREELTQRLVGLCEIWARSCIAERHSDVSDFGD